MGFKTQALLQHRDMATLDGFTSTESNFTVFQSVPAKQLICHVVLAYNVIASQGGWVLVNLGRGGGGGGLGIGWAV